ncbi:hypothetical protein [Streptomyces sp. NPDC090083]|uniref:hypothetical protein n=1 Tax=Streptomyces sp. NPDC090083 TaxID=3365941 RepID=UPI00380B4057
MRRSGLGVDRGGAVAPGVLDRPQRRPAGAQGEIDPPGVVRLLAQPGQRRVDGGGADETRLQVVGGDPLERRVGPPDGIRQGSGVARLQAEERGLREPGQQTGADQVVPGKPFGQPDGVRMRGAGRLEVAGRCLLRIAGRDGDRVVRRPPLCLGGEMVVHLVRQPVVLEPQGQRALRQPQVQHPAGPSRIAPLPHVERVLQHGGRGHRAVPAVLAPGRPQQPGRGGQPTAGILTGVGHIPLDVRCPPRLAAHQQTIHGCTYL